MKTGKMAGILTLMLLVVILGFIIGLRESETDNVVVDGGEAVTIDKGQTTPAPTPDVGDHPVQTADPADDLPKIDITSWEYTIANGDNTYKAVPKVSEVGNTGAFFCTKAVDALNAMVKDCTAAGYSIHINLAYVPYSTQEYYYNNMTGKYTAAGDTQEEAERKTSKIIARAGQSDHQTGLGVDITDSYFTPYTNETLNQKALDWLDDHCAEYGFIQRYPAGKESITGYRQSYHFRYVGVEAAQYITSHFLCLEEFAALYK